MYFLRHEVTTIISFLRLQIQTNYGMFSNRTGKKYLIQDVQFSATCYDENF